MSLKSKGFFGTRDSVKREESLVTSQRTSFFIVKSDPQETRIPSHTSPIAANTSWRRLWGKTREKQRGNLKWLWSMYFSWMFRSYRALCRKWKRTHKRKLAKKGHVKEIPSWMSVIIDKEIICGEKECDIYFLTHNIVNDSLDSRNFDR